MIAASLKVTPCEHDIRGAAMALLFDYIYFS